MLDFPNQSRVFDPTRRAVRFWGHDGAMEWSFYVSEDALKRLQPAMMRDEAALLSAFVHYDLPIVLRWFTANIGVHHVHHLCSRIPFYRLPLALRRHPELAKIGRLTLVQSILCVRLVLWDEAARRLISFRELRTLPGHAAG